MNGATVLTKFTADTKDFDSKTKGVTASLGSITKSVIAGIGITKAFSAAWSAVTRNMDSAIDRFDTLNNFPKVMSNLGIGAEDSQKSIDKMSEALVGLPTTLDEGALAVQRLTSKNGDIKKSTDLFLAMNNAILAGGAPAQIQSTAIEQLSQAYAKGKPDMMEWRTLMTAMPAQLKQVATAMGYVDADSLGEALREGNVSMDEFMNTIVNLNEKGLPGFQNFEEQARNSTGGIRTAITNMNSRITQGVTAMIESVDKGLKDAKLGGIAKAFETIGNTVRDTLKGLAPYIVKTVSFLVNLAKWINENKTWLEAIIIPLVAFIGTFSMIMKIISIVKGITTAISVLNAVMLANPIVLIIAAIVALIAIFVVLWKKCDWFRNFWIGLWNGIVEIVVGAWEWIKGIFNKIISFVSKNWKSLLLFLVNPFAGAFKLLYDNCEGFRNFINNFVNGIVIFIQSIPQKVSAFVQSTIAFIGKIPYYIGFAIGFIIGKIAQFAQAVPNFITSVINWFKELPSKIWEAMVDLGTKIASWFITTKDNVVNKTSEIINSVITWFQELPGRIWNTLVETFNNVKNWLINMYNTCKEAIKNLVNNIVNWFKKLPGDMLNIGKNIVEGLWNGIKNAKNWVVGKIKDFSKGILDGMKKALGIRSPSTEFALLGRFSVLGYTEELDKMAKTVQGQIAETFSVSPQLANSSSLHYSPNVVVNTVNNISQDPLGRMVNDIKTFSGGAKNDYNYGMGV